MYEKYIKRFLDIIFSFFALLILLIIFIPVALAIKFEDHGPIFYLDKRYGKDMKKFTMYKFRSMKVNAPDIRNSDGTTFNSKDDPRVTKVGKFIRKTSIDELPQILNVLLGHMSLIGPRPSPLGDKSQYGPVFMRKFEVKPGITGYSQAYLRNEASMEQRIEYDNFYIDNISFMFDVKIFFQTIVSVLKSKNIYRN